MKKRLLVFALALITISVLSACGDSGKHKDRYKDDEDTSVTIDTDNNNNTSSSDIEIDENILGNNKRDEIPDPPYSGSGSFDSIDYSVWAESDYSPEDYVGRWYEDGFENGYYLDIYGDGTWRLFTENETWGIIDAANLCVSFCDARYGLTVMSSMGYSDTDMYMSVGINEIAKVRNLSSYVIFRREYDCDYCDSLEDYYRDKYFCSDIAGRWDPINGSDSNEFVIIYEDGSWEYRINNSALGVGMLEKVSDNLYETVSGSRDRFASFEYSYDGTLYIDSEMYVRIQDSEREEAPDEIIGTYYYYNEAAGEYYGAGYVFNRDWTFETLLDNDVQESGFFIRIGDNVLLYDNDCNQIHKFYQNDMMYGESIQDDERESLVNTENF